MMWNCYSRMMRITGTPSVFNYSLHYKKSIFTRRGLEPITDGAEPRPLTQTAAPRRRRVRYAQTCLDADHGVSVADPPTVFVIAHLS